MFIAYQIDLATYLISLLKQIDDRAQKNVN